MEDKRLKYFSFSIPEDLDEPAGVYEIRVRFDGDAYYNPTAATGTLTVLEETVVITVPDKVTCFFGTVTLEATVIDDDGELLLGGPYTLVFMVGDYLR